MDYKIREMSDNDIDQAMDLLLRLKRLNSEFDYALRVSSNNEQEIREKLKKIVNDRDNHISLVIESNKKIVGILISDIIFRIYYDPKYEARIREIYVLPEFRSKGIGKEFIDKFTDVVNDRGINMVTAEFPSLNTMAINFYKNLGFRELIKIYSKIQ